MAKKGLKNQLTGYKKIIHDEMFKVDYEKLLQQSIEGKYIEYYSNTGKHPNFEELLQSIKCKYIEYYSNIGKHPKFEEYFTVIKEKYKGLTFNEVLKLYKETYF